MTQQPDATPKVVAGSDQTANEAVPPKDRTTSGAPATAARPPDAPVQPGDQKLADRQEAQEGDGEDYSGKAAELEAELAKVRSKARGGDMVRVRVEGEHAGIIHNGVWVGNDWTEVPAHVVPDMMEGAANSGVVLTQEETES